MEPMIPQKPLWSEIVQSQDGQIKKPGRSSSKGQQKLLFTNMTLLLSSSGEPEEFASLSKDEEVYAPVIVTPRVYCCCDQHYNNVPINNTVKKVGSIIEDQVTLPRSGS